MHVAEQRCDLRVELGAALAAAEHVVNHFRFRIVHVRFERVAAFDDRIGGALQRQGCGVAGGALLQIARLGTDRAHVLDVSPQAIERRARLQRKGHVLLQLRRGHGAARVGQHRAGRGVALAIDRQFEGVRARDHHGTFVGIAGVELGVREALRTFMAQIPLHAVDARVGGELRLGW